MARTYREAEGACSKVTPPDDEVISAAPPTAYEITSRGHINDGPDDPLALCEWTPWIK